MDKIYTNSENNLKSDSYMQKDSESENTDKETAEADFE